MYELEGIEAYIVNLIPIVNCSKLIIFYRNFQNSFEMCRPKNRWHIPYAFSFFYFTKQLCLPPKFINQDNDTDVWKSNITKWQYVIAPSLTLTFNETKRQNWCLRPFCIQCLIRNSYNFKSHLPIPLKKWHTAMVLWLKIAEGNLFLWRGIKDNKFLNIKSYIDANWKWRQQCKTYKTIIQHDLYIKVLHSWVLITAFVNWGEITTR